MALVKKGSCKNCGRCCDQNCPHFSWEALRLIKKGEKFKTGTDEGYVKSFCDIFDQDITCHGCTLDQRKNFPYNPEQTPPECGFYWEEE
jgi:Fe-S-cluster containining protein